MARPPRCVLPRLVYVPGNCYPSTTNAGPMERYAIILLLCALSGILSCGGSLSLTSEERAKLDPKLQALFDAPAPPERGYDISYRADGTPEYAVIVRSLAPDDIRALGVRVTSVFNDVITVRATKEELAALARLSSVRALLASGLDTLH